MGDVAGPRGNLPAGWDGARVGSLVGAVGGLAFVLFNTWPLAVPWPTVVIAVGVVWFLLVLRAVWRVPPDPDGYRPDSRQMQAFWIIVALEVVAILAGTNLAIRVLDRPDLSLPWVATVLGLHWLAFRRVFQREAFLYLGLLTLTCGVTGLLIAATGIAGEYALETSAISCGLLVGAVMLWCVGLDATRRRRAILSGASRRPRGRSS